MASLVQENPRNNSAAGANVQSTRELQEPSVSPQRPRSPSKDSGVASSPNASHSGSSPCNVAKDDDAGGAWKGKDPSYAALLREQQRELPRVMSELEKHRRKVSCWAWYVFPTDKAGNLDPHRTKVSVDTAADLCTNPKTCVLWQQ
eukprot:24267-Amphidinium_carterae.1